MYTSCAGNCLLIVLLTEPTYVLLLAFTALSASTPSPARPLRPRHPPTLRINLKEAVNTHTDIHTEPAWGRSREFDITTRTVRKGAGSAGDFEDEDEEATVVKGSTRSMIAFMPAQGKQLLSSIPLHPSCLLRDLGSS